MAHEGGQQNAAHPRHPRAGGRDRRLSSRMQMVLVVVLALAGVSLMGYPLVSAMVNQRYADEMISAAEVDVANLDEVAKQEMLEAARAYNESLTKSKVVMTDPFDADAARQATETYEQTLNVNGQGMMATLDIPAINVHLPVMHSVSSEVLARAVGHLPETSLPVGGMNTHAVLSAHTGMLSATLFTNLEELRAGDVFRLRVLDEELWYKVSEIEVVEPSDISSLKIDPGRDQVTLVTCTPYGVNSHRLLVHGDRTDAPPEGLGVAGGRALPWWLLVLLAALAILVVVGAVVRSRRRRTRVAAARKRLQAHAAAVGLSSDGRLGDGTMGNPGVNTAGGIAGSDARMNPAVCSEGTGNTIRSTACPPGEAAISDAGFAPIAPGEDIVSGVSSALTTSGASEAIVTDASTSALGDAGVPIKSVPTSATTPETETRS